MSAPICPACETAARLIQTATGDQFAQKRQTAQTLIGADQRAGAKVARKPAKGGALAGTKNQTLRGAGDAIIEPHETTPSLPRKGADR